MTRRIGVRAKSAIAAKRNVQNRSLLQSVQRALAVLDAIAHQTAPISVSELAIRMGIDRTIVHRILRTLHAEELVQRVQGRWEIGPRALIFGNAYHEALALRHAALPYMVDLLRSLGERELAASIAVAVRKEVIIVDQVWNPGMRLDLIFGQGSLFPLDQSASGRALMAYMPSAKVIDLIGARRGGELKQAFSAVRRAGGIAFQTSAVQPGNSAIAAVIFSRSGEPRGALVLSGLGLEGDLAAQSPLADQVRAYAARIGRLL